MRIFIINGPNINLLGSREPETYGHTDLETLRADLRTAAAEMGVEVKFFQSNCEGEIIDNIHLAGERADGIIINPAAYTHYSLAIRDALGAVDVPALEVHISAVHSREKFRRVSVTAPACAGGIWGMGTGGYTLALRALVGRLGRSRPTECETL